MNKIKKYGIELQKNACKMRNVLKDDKLNKNRDKHFADYEIQNKLYNKALFMIKLGNTINKQTTL